MEYRIGIEVGAIACPDGPRTPAEADRELHGAIVQATSSLPRVPSYAFYDMRRKRNRPWGHVLRMIDELVEAGVSTDRIVLIGALVRAYAIERCMERSARLYGSPKSAA